MPIMESIKAVQDFRSLLANWGVTAGGLVAIALIAFIFFLISAREVLGWFLKTGGVRDEVRDLKREIAELKELVERLNGTEPQIEAPAEKITPLKKDAQASTARGFRLDH